MSPALAVRIIECAHDDNKELYHTALHTVAEARKLRPTFFERTPRAARHKDMAAMLARPRLELPTKAAPWTTFPPASRTPN